MMSLEKLKIWTPLQKLPKNVRDLGKLIVATGLEKTPKVQIIAQSGHTDSNPRPSKHESPPITTRPGLLPFLIYFFQSTFQFFNKSI